MFRLHGAARSGFGTAALAAHHHAVIYLVHSPPFALHVQAWHMLVCFSSCALAANCLRLEYLRESVLISMFDSFSCDFCLAHSYPKCLLHVRPSPSYGTYFHAIAVYSKVKLKMLY